MEIVKLYDVGGGEASADASRAVAEAAAGVAEDLRKEREARQCAICLSRLRATVLLPCRHNVMCETCTQHVVHSSGRCPFCRQAIESSMVVFN